MHHSLMSALIIKDLTKIYNNGFHALKKINLNVQEGDFFALLGANGAGKSTTIGILSSLINKTSGTIKVFCHDLDTEPNLVKTQIGLVPQEFNCNIFEKCELILQNQAGYYGIPKRIAKERAQYYLNKLKLWDKRNETARSLSGGMKRRLMIARALVHQPKMLILDEPTAGVDIEIRHSMWDFLQEINDSGTTIILTTHYLEEAEKLCKQIAIIKNGEIALRQSMKEFLSYNENQTILVELTQPLLKPPAFTNFKVELIEEKKLKLVLNKDITLNAVFSELSQHNINITHLQNETTRLEHLFLGLINDE
jgi:ABC-2 type transport system ATP-binding protein